MTRTLDSTFSALSDPTRREILKFLAHRPEMSVGEIAAPFGISLPAISKHLDVLENADLLVRAKTRANGYLPFEPWADGGRHALAIGL